jgi:hypothetical protein
MSTLDDHMQSPLGKSVGSNEAAYRPEQQHTPVVSERDLNRETTIIDHMPEQQLWQHRGQWAVKFRTPLSETTRADIPDPPAFLPRSFYRCWMEGVATTIYNQGKMNWHWSEWKTANEMGVEYSYNHIGRPRDLTAPLDTFRPELPWPVSDDLWARMKDDRPVYDLPPKPWYLALYLQQDAEEAAKVKEYLAASQEHNRIEHEMILPLAWWRGFAQARKDAIAGAHQDAVRQEALSVPESKG